MKKYNSIAILAFTVEHDTKDPLDTDKPAAFIGHVRRRLLSRVKDLNERPMQWFEALDFQDTVEGGLHED